MWTFLIMLLAIVLAGGLALSARSTYLPDVATAAASVRMTSGGTGMQSGRGD
jgi:hypothetical protein